MFDLFNQFNQKNHQQFKHELSDEIGLWTNYLNLKVTETLRNTIIRVNQDRLTNVVFPAPVDVFKVFKLIDKPSDVKVIIIGQDPYYNGHANGLAFGCQEEISVSLKVIVKTIKKTLDVYKPSEGSNMSLEYLAKQGVMLLNTILTVRAGEPLSHKNFEWQVFTTYMVNKVIEENPDVMILLWGKEAQNLEKDLPATANILKASHPAAAARMNIRWECDHFKMVNEYLISTNKTPITWF